ncbi:MAG: hypothetical protein JO340_16995 [Acidobacteriaceae bacterium]|nr:hypothetical protein [Acidobacteriaceae bacterium]
MSWGHDLSELERKAASAKLKILIWGPGKSPCDAGRMENRRYRKRLKIRDTLRKAYPNSEVYFSEDEALRKHTRHLGSLMLEEEMHTRTADCILALPISRDSELEIDHFWTKPEIARKLYAFVPKRFSRANGLVRVVYKELKSVYGYTDAEFSDCSLATVKCVQIVRSICVARLLALDS